MNEVLHSLCNYREQLPDSHPVNKARDLDRQGKSEDAVRLLARAIKEGQLQAAVQLGKRLLVGDRAPVIPKEGLRLLNEAAKRGSGEAASQLAVLSALGLYVPRDIAQALQLLAFAAAQQWKPAMGQLCVLTDQAALARRAAMGQVTAASWQELAQTVDPALWCETGKQEVVNQGPRICRVPEFLSGAVCEWLMEMARDRLEPARVYDSVKKRETVHRTRSNTQAVFNLLQTDVVNILVQCKMAAAAGAELAFMEAATVLHYNPGEQILEHFDFIDPRSPDYEAQIQAGGQRYITFLVYLNDDYEMGRTVFPRLDVAVRGRQGEGLYFVNTTEADRPNLQTAHAGEPPEAGEKWILSQFIRRTPVLKLNS